MTDTAIPDEKIGTPSDEGIFDRVGAHIEKNVMAEYRDYAREYFRWLAAGQPDEAPAQPAGIDDKRVRRIRSGIAGHYHSVGWEHV